MNARVTLGTAKDQAPANPLTSQIAMKITGMTCASCSGRLERALRHVPGVATANVNLLTETASVTGAGGALRPSDLLAAVRDTGFSGEIETGTTDEGAGALLKESHRQRFETWRLIAMIVLSAPLLLPMLGVPLSPWVELLLATPVQFGFGARYYIAAWRALMAGAADMDLLVVLGTSAAYGYSLFLLAAGLTASRSMHMDMMGGMHLYFESAALVLTFITLGKWLEARAKRSTTTALKELVSLRPAMATIERAGGDIELPISALSLDDSLVVKPGARIPADGVVTSGSSDVDEGLITGESMPVTKSVDSTVIGGSINGSGLLKVRVTAVGAQSTLDRIIALVTDAQLKKAGLQRLADRVSAVFVPVVLCVAAVTIIGWWIADGSFSAGLVPAVSVLVVACPCALGLATPTALMVGTGVAARSGILIRDVEALERARRIDIVALDKTGTLTEGRPKVTRTIALDGDTSGLLRLVASAQQGSEHPLARAVLQAAAGQDLAPVTNFQSKPGFGLTATIAERSVAIGNRQLMAEHGVATTPLEEDAVRLEGDGATVMWIASLEAPVQLLGIIAATDSLKPTAKEAVARLHSEGIDTVLLTGDNERSAASIAREVGITDVKAGLKPADKATEIERLQALGKRVAMVGDGINDAPALATADVGIAIGTGADVAIETAAITLLRGDPLLIAAAISISRATYAKIVQGLFWAFIYNVIGLPLAAFGFFNPMIAGALMALSSVSVVANALLLRRWHA